MFNLERNINPKEVNQEDKTMRSASYEGLENIKLKIGKEYHLVQKTAV